MLMELHFTQAPQVPRLPCPQRFDGSDKNLDNFAYRLQGYLTAVNPLFKRIMRQAQDAAREILWEPLEHDIKQMAAQLQQALIALRDGPSSNIVQRSQESDNGFETWRHFVLDISI